MILPPLVGIALQVLAAATTDSARVVNGRLVVEPLGISFQIPPVWLGLPDALKRDRSCANTPGGTVADRIKVRRQDFASLRGPTGEWKREYDAVVESMLPFRSLVAHLGGDPWDGNCGAIQMRVYVGAFSGRRMATQAIVGARVASRYFRPVRRVVAVRQAWTRVSLSWKADYGDYFGTAHVEVWTRPVKGRFLVLVFMFGDGMEQRADIDGIVASFHTA